METIKSDNELIAEFMGFEKTGTFYENNGVRYDKYKSSDFGYTYPAEWAFDTKWDWLMPVIIAIEEIEMPHPSNNPEKGTVWPYNVDLLSRNKIEIYDHINEHSIAMIDSDGISKIDAAYKAVVQFIKWYNQKSLTS